MLALGAVESAVSRGAGRRRKSCDELRAKKRAPPRWQRTRPQPADTHAATRDATA